MEDNKKGFNTLYLVLGVSTLVVAIIGATFAFFSASQTNDNVITGNIAEAGGLVLNVESITYDPTDDTYATTTGNDIIPLNLITNQTLKAGSESEYVDATSQFAQAMAKKCRDDLGNNICEVYKITVENQSATATIQIRGRLTLNSNAKNMYWKLIDATTEDVTLEVEPTEGEEATEPEIIKVLASGTEKEGIVPVKQNETVNNYLTVKYTTDDAGTRADQTQVNVGTEDEPSMVATNVGANVTLAGSGKAEYYVVVWLEETGAEQQDDDASAEGSQKYYRGTVTFDAVDAAGNKSGVTATFLS